jgi:hypothetical protein
MIVSLSPTNQLTKDAGKAPKVSVGILIGITLFGLFIVGYDQEQLFSIAQGETAYDEIWMH